MIRNGMRTSLFLISSLLFAQVSTPWRDPSPHRVQLVPVENGVTLEVLDWGGTGTPIVLLAGYLSAHAYDDFAPQLASLGHVYGITRRGLGASSHPASGYTAQRSAEDVLKVLDTLKLDHPVLAGHSFGGQDLTTLAAAYPERVAALIYLNSAEDPTVTDYGVKPPDPQKLPAAMRVPPKPDLRSFQAYRDWQRQTQGCALPESELRNLYAANPDGSLGAYLVTRTVRDALFHGLQKPDYARIRIPVLAIFAALPGLEDQLRRYPPRNQEERTALEQQHQFDLAIQQRHIQDLKTGIPAARIVELPGANFYIFLSNPADLLREIRTFLRPPPVPSASLV